MIIQSKFPKHANNPSFSGWYFILVIVNPTPTDFNMIFNSNDSGAREEWSNIKV